MAKKRTINVRNFKFTAEGLQLLADVEFTVKHDGETYLKGEEGHPYKCTLDLLMKQPEAVHHIVNTAVINLQNKRIRPMARSDAKAQFDGKVITMKDLYPGRGMVVMKREMTDEELMAELVKRGLKERFLKEAEDMDE